MSIPKLKEMRTNAPEKSFASDLQIANVFVNMFSSCNRLLIVKCEIAPILSEYVAQQRNIKRLCKKIAGILHISNICVTI